MAAPVERPITIATVSGKGGVGKTAVTIGMALALQELGYKVGIVDLDLESSSLGDVLGVTREQLIMTEKIEPASVQGIKVMSLALFPQEDWIDVPTLIEEERVYALVGQMFKSVNWGELDFLCVDFPPGCLDKGTRITTNAGPSVPIDQVRPHAPVYSFRGSLEGEGKPGKPYVLAGGLESDRVATLVLQGSMPMVEVRTRHFSLTASSNHPLLALRRLGWGQYQLRWSPIRQLKEGDIVAVVKALPKGGFPYVLPWIPEIRGGRRFFTDLPRETSPDFCRLLGFFVGDGYINLNESGGRLVLCEPRNGMYREQYARLVEQLFHAPVSDDRWIRVNSTRLARFFKTLYPYDRAPIKRIPAWVFRLPGDQREAFLEGYTDADGHRRKVSAPTSKHNRIGNVGFCSASEGLIQDLYDLCLSVGRVPQHIVKRTRRNKWRASRAAKESKVTSYEFEVSCGDGKGLDQMQLCAFGRGMRLNGRQPPGKRGLQHPEVGFERILVIEPAGARPGYDLQLKSHNNFIANGFIAHNSGPELRALIRQRVHGLILVTAAQRVSELPVRRLVRMARDEYRLTVLGVVSNNPYGVEGVDSGKAVAERYGLPLLASIPWDKTIVHAMDNRTPLPLEHFRPIARALQARFFPETAAAAVSVAEAPNAD